MDGGVYQLFCLENFKIERWENVKNIKDRENKKVVYKSIYTISSSLLAKRLGLHDSSWYSLHGAVLCVRCCAKYLHALFHVAKTL